MNPISAVRLVSALCSVAWIIFSTPASARASVIITNDPIVGVPPIAWIVRPLSLSDAGHTYLSTYAGGAVINQVRVTNVNNLTTKITGVAFQNPAPYGLSVTSDCDSLDPLASCTVTVEYAPHEPTSTSVEVTLTVSTQDLLEKAEKNYTILPAMSRPFEPFMPCEEYPTGSNPEATAIADVTGDGKPDLVVTTSVLSTPDASRDRKLVVFPGTGQGSFGSPIRYDLVTSPGNPPKSIATGDLNGDGRTDVAVGNAGNNLQIFYQNTEGTLDAGIVTTTSTSSDIKTGDFNRDGRKDLVALDGSTGRLQVYYQKPDGTLDSPVDIGTLGEGFDTIATGDLNNDGFTDLAIKSSSTTTSIVAVLLQSDSGFNTPQYYDIDEPSSAQAIAIGDVNGDNLQDVALRYYSTWRYEPGIAVFTQNASGTLDPVLMARDYSVTNSLGFADVDHDERPELISLMANTIIASRFPDSGPVTARYMMDMPLYGYSYPSLARPQRMTLGDADGDSYTDLLAAYPSAAFLCRGRNPLVALRMTPSALDFGAMPTGTTTSKTVTITNDGSADGILGSVTVTENTAFAIRNDSCSGQTLIPGATCTFDIAFSPSSPNLPNAEVKVKGTPIRTPVKGTGTVPVTFIRFSQTAGGMINGERFNTNVYGDVIREFGGSRSTVASFNADSGYRIKDVLIDGISQGAVSSLVFTKGGSRSVHVVFDRFISVTATEGGSITPIGFDTGIPNRYLISPKPGYRISDVLINGVSGGPMYEVSFPSNQLLTPQTVHAVFTLTGKSTAYAYVPDIVADKVSVIETATNTIVGRIPVGNDAETLAVSPTGSVLMVANYLDDTITVIDTLTNTVVDTVPVGHGPDFVTFGSNYGVAYVSNFEEGSISILWPDSFVYDASIVPTGYYTTGNQSQYIAETVPVCNKPLGLSVSPDGHRLYVACSADNTIRFLDAWTLQTVTTLKVGKFPTVITQSPDGKKLYVSNTGSGTISIIDVEKKRVAKTVKVGKAPMGLALAADGETLYVALAGEGRVAELDTSSKNVTRRFGAGNGVFGLSLNETGERLFVVARDDRKMHVFDTIAKDYLGAVDVGPAIGIGSFVTRNVPGLQAPQTVDFGAVKAKKGNTVRTIAIRSDWHAAIKSATVTGDAGAGFTISRDTCNGATLSPSGTCEIDITFDPEKKALWQAELTILAAEPERETKIRLVGRGK